MSIPSFFACLLLRFFVSAAPLQAFLCPGCPSGTSSWHSNALDACLIQNQFVRPQGQHKTGGSPLLILDFMTLKEHHPILTGLHSRNKKSCKSNHQVFMRSNSKHVLLRSWSSEIYCTRPIFCKDSSEQASGVFQFTAHRSAIVSFCTKITTSVFHSDLI